MVVYCPLNGPYCFIFFVAHVFQLFDAHLPLLWYRFEFCSPFPINGSSHFVKMFHIQSLWFRAKVAVDCSGDDVCRLVLWALNGLLLCVVHGVKKCYLLLRQGFM